MTTTLIELTQKQLETKDRVQYFAKLFGIDPLWASAVAMVESSLGSKQCKGVFTMSSAAMRDLLDSMPVVDDELTDIACGVALLRLLLKRHGSIEEATSHFCNPKDRTLYLQRVEEYMRAFSESRCSLTLAWADWCNTARVVQAASDPG